MMIVNMQVYVLYFTHMIVCACINFVQKLQKEIIEGISKLQFYLSSCSYQMGVSLNGGTPENTPKSSF